MLSALGAKLSRNTSRQRESKDSFFVPLGIDTERSSSLNRGRDFHSTGRGGVGNFRATSSSRDARPDSGPDDFSPTRGREPHVRNIDPVFSTGRGGSGNIRSPSRDPSKLDPTEASDQILVREHIIADENLLHSTGRGGVGNINRSRSRDVQKANASTTTVHSSGRGGVGNIHNGPAISEKIEEEERQKVGHAQDGVHSTGRGGAANLTAAHEPNVEHHAHQGHEYESTGRGGAGNLVHTT